MDDYNFIFKLCNCMLKYRSDCEQVPKIENIYNAVYISIKNGNYSKLTGHERYEILEKIGELYTHVRGEHKKVLDSIMVLLHNNNTKINFKMKKANINKNNINPSKDILGRRFTRRDERKEK